MTCVLVVYFNLPGGSDVCDHGAVRLADSLEEGVGRVEICLGNRWGTVCHRSFDELDAAVLCRQLGYYSEGASSSRSMIPFHVPLLQ